MNQVHKEQLASVDNALANRSGLEVEIFGMEGIPEEVVQSHNQRIIAQFYQAEADRRAATGNPSAGSGAPATKKPKFESASELKKRLAEHKAKLAEQAANGGSSGGATPREGNPTIGSPALGHSPAAFNASPYAPTPQVPYGSFPQEPYAQNATAHPQSYPPPQTGFPAQYPPPQAQFSPPPQYPPQSFPPPGYQPPPTTFHGGPPPRFGGSPPGSFNPYQPPPSHSPPQNSLPARPATLPPATGLPQRPSFGAPPVPPYQMQQMHQGQQAPPNQHPRQGPPQGAWAAGGNGWNGPGNQNSAMSSAYPNSQGLVASNGSAVGNNGSAQREADDIDELIRMAEAGIKPPKKGDPIPAQTASLPTSETPQPAEVAEKKSKKDRGVKMLYSDNEMSPEEKMAKMLRYAFIPDGKDNSVKVEAAA